MARPSLFDLDPARVAFSQRAFESIALRHAKRTKGRTSLSYLADAERHRNLAERAERAVSVGGWEVA